MKHFQLCILTIMLLSLFALAHSLEITSSLDWCGTSPCKLHREGTCRSLFSFLPQSFPLPSFILFFLSCLSFLTSIIQTPSAPTLQSHLATTFNCLSVVTTTPLIYPQSMLPSMATGMTASLFLFFLISLFALLCFVLFCLKLIFI